MEPLKHLLIVEDDYLIAADMMLNLKREGYAISGLARNMQEAVKIISSAPVDLALIDMMLDGPEDGVITATELLKIKWVPIIYITGSTPLLVKDRIKKTFPAAFFPKPLRFGELAVQIELAISNFDAGIHCLAPDKNGSDHIYLPSSSGLIHMKVNQIVCIEAEKRKSHVFLSKNELLRIFPKNTPAYVTVNVNIGRIFPQLPARFFELSRSSVINLDYIDKINGHDVYLQSRVVTVPDARKQLLMDQLTIIKK